MDSMPYWYQIKYYSLILLPVLLVPSWNLAITASKRPRVSHCHNSIIYHSKSVPMGAIYECGNSYPQAHIALAMFIVADIQWECKAEVLNKIEIHSHGDKRACVTMHTESLKSFQ